MRHSKGEAKGLDRYPWHALPGVSYNWKMNLVTKFTFLLISFGVGALAFAQGHTCTRNNGTVYSSTLPCPKPGLIIYGPTDTGIRSIPNYPKLRPAGEELQYMSAECSAVSEGIRTAPARGLKYDVISQLQREFDGKCSEEQAQARKRLYDERAQQRNGAQELQQNSQKLSLMSQQEKDRLFAQCAEMRKAIANRKAKTNMTDGEKNDLVTFEQRYQSRCY